ncbi:MAG: AraC family transcriptional regulator [Victivallales bacterium]|nr:AraC family transcriptional regulator [Victivallales bacterium]
MNFYSGLKFPAFGSAPKHHGISRHTPLYHGIQYNHSGSFFIRINHGPEIRAEGPCAFITHPGSFFEYGYYDGTTRHHSNICTRGDRIKKYLSSGLMVINDASPVIKVNHPDRFLKTVLEIVALLRNNAPATPPRAVLLFEDLLLQLHHEPVKRGELIPAHQYDFFKKLISDVRENPEYNWCFEKISLQHGLTFRYFRRLFKAMAGMPPQQFLIQCRLQLAASLLVENVDTVSSIAESAGFGSNIYFSRLFKHQYKVTPLEYRKEFSHLP